MPNPSEREKQIDEIIESMYYETGIYGYWQELRPEIFEVLVQQLIPKRREQIRCILEREEKKAELKEQQAKLSQSRRMAKGYGATLRFWETNKPFAIKIRLGKLTKTIEINYAYLLNNSFDWFLKMGLTVVPVLSLFGIFGITDILDPLGDGLLPVAFIMFASITLVWLTSVTIFNLIIGWGKSTRKNVEEPDPLKLKINDKDIFKLSILPRSLWIVLIIVFVILAESLIGFSIIPGLINLARTRANTGLDEDKQLELLKWYEQLEIMFGISIFALINVLSAIAKARLYQSTMRRKIRYAKAVADWHVAEEIMQRLSTEVEELEGKILHLEKEVFPNYEMDEIKNAMQALSNEVTLGETYRGKNPRKYSQSKDGNSNPSPSSLNPP